MNTRPPLSGGSAEIPHIEPGVTQAEAEVKAGAATPVIIGALTSKEDTHYSPYGACSEVS